MREIILGDKSFSQSGMTRIGILEYLYICAHDQHVTSLSFLNSCPEMDVQVCFMIKYIGDLDTSFQDGAFGKMELKNGIWIKGIL